MKLTISRKLLLIYFFMALLTALSSTYAMVSLSRINHLVADLATRDFSLLDTSKEMIGLLLDMESAEKKFLILRDPSIGAIYWARHTDLQRLLQSTRKKSHLDHHPLLDRISVLNGQYADTFRREVALIADQRLTEAVLLSQNRGQVLIKELTQTTRALQKKAETDIQIRLARINDQGEKSSNMTIVLITFSLTAGFLLALLVTYNISRPLIQLKRATGEIAEGRFDYPVDIVRADEIGSLAKAFRTMKERLKILESKLRDESPLTGLPGNRAIEEMIGKRLSEKKPFALCHVDLDHFKPFADKYGYAWGSEVIKEVADLIREKQRSYGDPSDFVGHIGGDDYVIIAEPGRAEAICRAVVDEFDGRIAKYYNQNDRENGFIVGKDRQGIMRKFPLISLSIAIVTDGGNRFQTPLDMAEKAAELKERVKTLKGNNVVKLEDMNSSPA